MPVFKRGKNWVYRRVVNRPDGTRIRIRGGPRRYNLANTKISAVEAESRHVAQTMAGEGGARSGVTVTDFSSTFISASKLANKPTTVREKERALRDHILPLIGTKRIAHVSFTDIEKLKSSLAHLSNKTARNIIAVLSRMLKLAYKHGLIVRVPDIEWPKAERQEFDFLTFDEANALASAESQIHEMILIALKTGMRIGEIVGLTWNDVDMKNKKIIVRRAWVKGAMTSTKSGRQREIPLSDSALAALKSLERKNDIVFSGVSGRRITGGQVTKLLWKACDTAGLRRIGWHVLRHTFASHLAMRGVPLKAIQELLGHGSISMTMRYAHLSPEISRDAIALID